MTKTAKTAPAESDAPDMLAMLIENAKLSLAEYDRVTFAGYEAGLDRDETGR